MAIDGVLFDKDGTLFDFNGTWGGWTKAFLTSEARGDAGRLAAMAGAMGFDLEAGRFHPESLVIAGTVAEVAAALLPFYPGATQEDMTRRLDSETATAPQAEVTPLGPFVQGLAKRGLKLGVATNDSEAPARAHLRAAGIESHFDFIAGFDSGFGGKPEPGQLLAFAEAFGLRPENCAMVGDSLHDLHAGRAAGFVCVGVLTGLASADDLAPVADVILPDISHLPDWLDA